MVGRSDKKPSPIIRRPGPGPNATAPWLAGGGASRQLAGLPILEFAMSFSRPHRRRPLIAATAHAAHAAPKTASGLVPESLKDGTGPERLARKPRCRSITAAPWPTAPSSTVLQTRPARHLSPEPGHPCWTEGVSKDAKAARPSSPAVRRKSPTAPAGAGAACPNATLTFREVEFKVMR